MSWELEICGTRLSSLEDSALQERVLRGLWAMEARGEARRVGGSLVGDTWRVSAVKAAEAREALVGMGVPPTLLRMVAHKGLGLAPLCLLLLPSLAHASPGGASDWDGGYLVAGALLLALALLGARRLLVVAVLLLLAGPAWATVGRDNRDLRPVAVEVEEDCDPRCEVSRDAEIPPLRGPEPNAPTPYRPAWDSSGPSALRVLQAYEALHATKTEPKDPPPPVEVTSDQITPTAPRSLPIGPPRPHRRRVGGSGVYGGVAGALAALLLAAYAWLRWGGGVLRVRGQEIEAVPWILLWPRRSVRGCAWERRTEERNNRHDWLLGAMWAALRGRS